MPIALLFVGVAPPDQGSPDVRTAAKSATNDPEDNLRKFIEAAMASRWDDLIAEHVLLIHVVKCAIVPDEEGFQNPPNEVVDRCRPVGFADELLALRPTRIVSHSASKSGRVQDARAAERGLAEGHILQAWWHGVYSPPSFLSALCGGKAQRYSHHPRGCTPLRFR
jgi:hypothetical protein